MVEQYIGNRAQGAAVEHDSSTLNPTKWHGGNNAVIGQQRMGVNSRKYSHSHIINSLDTT